uniref:Metalloendopeptidase n=1 Tax=Strongyloides stercoralis TaxID=6248 RepID=A0A0K0E581_STRER
MKIIIYSYISILILFILIIVSTIIKLKYYFKKHLIINKKLLPDQITVNNNMIFTENHINFKREIRKNTSNEWILPINYSVQSPVDKTNIEVAIEILKNNTCVTFQKREEISANESGIIFVKSPYCESLVGKKDGNHSQEISLSKECQQDPYIILHELGHALGLVHEHARNDRDKYISIDYSQLNKIGENNFAMISHRTFLSYDTEYDYASLMHYEPYTFGSWWYRLFGWPLLNWCNWVQNGTNYRHPNRNISCENSGYPDFRNCSRCLCPTGYTGDLCDNVIQSDSVCGNTTFIAKENVTTLIYNNKMNCYITIEAPQSRTIEITILYVNAPYRDKICTEDIAYQFKYRKDRGATGLLLCGHHQKHMKLNSETNTSLVFYKGIELHSLLVFQYKMGGYY